MSHRGHRVSTNRSKLQRQYYGSDLDEPPAYHSGTWLYPLRNTNARGRSVVVERPVDVMVPSRSSDGVVPRTNPLVVAPSSNILSPAEKDRGAVLRTAVTDDTEEGGTRKRTLTDEGNTGSYPLAAQ